MALEGILRAAALFAPLVSKFPQLQTLITFHKIMIPLIALIALIRL
jgi:hypothetical protein